MTGLTVMLSLNPEVRMGLVLLSSWWFDETWVLSSFLASAFCLQNGECRVDTRMETLLL